jgi:hypothetical protein
MLAAAFASRPDIVGFCWVLEKAAVLFLVLTRSLCASSLLPHGAGLVGAVAVELLLLVSGNPRWLDGLCRRFHPAESR